MKMAPVTRLDDPSANGTVFQHDKIIRRTSGPLNLRVLNVLQPQLNGSMCFGCTSCSTTVNHTKVSRRSTDACSVRLVQCTVHLDQLHKNGELKAMPKLKQSYQKSTEGRLVHPLVFKPFSPEMLNEASPDGNVTFIMELESLLTRFPRCSLLAQPTFGSVELLLTRRTRDVDRYVNDKVFDETENLESMVTKITNLMEQYSSNVVMYVDVLPYDFRFFRKRWVREFVNHEHCTLGGELCTNLMTRDVAWDACNF